MTISIMNLKKETVEASGFLQLHESDITWITAVKTIKNWRWKGKYIFKYVIAILFVWPNLVCDTCLNQASFSDRGIDR